MPISFAENDEGNVATNAKHGHNEDNVATFADPPPYSTEDALKQLNALTPAEKSKLSVGIAKAVSSSAADEELKKVSTDAVQAVGNIDKMFVTLLAKIFSFDEKDLVEKFKVVQKAFHDLSKKSVSQAATIAGLSDSFDKSIVKFCADKNVAIDKRTEKIQGFINDVQKVHTEADSLKEEFNALNNQFAEFVGQFKHWAEAREAYDNQKIKDIEKEIEGIDEQIKKINTALMVLYGTLAATLPITGVLTLLFLPAAPWIIGTGAALAGLQIAAVTTLTLERNKLLNDKRKKEDAIKDLQDEITKIKAARSQLETDGQADLLVFYNNVSAIQEIWAHVLTDATEILGWLKDGADYSKLDETHYMQDSLNDGIRVYSKMAQYLRDYSNGVSAKARLFK